MLAIRALAVQIRAVMHISMCLLINSEIADIFAVFAFTVRPKSNIAPGNNGQVRVNLLACRGRHTEIVSMKGPALSPLCRDSGRCA